MKGNSATSLRRGYSQQCDSSLLARGMTRILGRSVENSWHRAAVNVRVVPTGKAIEESVDWARR